VDGSGHKMSKSKGNVIAPQKIFDTLGADILRLWVAATDYSGELTISDEILKRVVESYRRIRNTLRFLLANTADYDHAKHALPVDQWLEIDRYALALTQKLQDEVRADYERYEFHLIAQRLQTFCSEDLGGFYLDILKDRLYTAGANSAARRSAQNALYNITNSLVRLMAPILSFTAEEVWELLSGKEDDSVFASEWYDLPILENRVEIFTRWQKLREIRATVQKFLETLRMEGKIGSSLQAEVEVGVDGSTYDVLKDIGNELRFILNTSQTNFYTSATVDVSFSDVSAVASQRQKCERCWHYRADVGADAQHPTLCGRCVSNLYGTGEARRYA